MSKMHARIDEITSSISSLRKRRYDKGSMVEQLENQMRMTRREMNALQSETHDAQLQQAKKQAYLENALNRLNSDYQMTYEYACEQRKEIDIEKAKDRVAELRQAINRLGNVN